MLDSIGVLVSLVLGVSLFFSKNNISRSPKILAVLLLACSLTLLNDMLVTTGIANRFQFLYFTPIYYSLSIGPLFYFFVASKFRASYPFRKRDVLHLLLPLIQALVYFSIGFRNETFKSILWEQSQFPIYLDIETALFPISLTGYTLFAQSIIRRHQETNSFWSADLIKWLRQFSIGILTIAIIELVSLLGEFLPYEYLNNSYLALLRSLVFTGFVFWIAINGFKQYFVSYIYTSKPNKLVSKGQPEAAATQLEEITHLMISEKIYQNPELTIQLLASYLGKTEKLTSSIINQGTGGNFNAFVNSYRIEDFKDRILKGEHQKVTLTSIAYDCGFDSKSTFNRVFKQNTGMTPSQFVKTIPHPN